MHQKHFIRHQKSAKRQTTVPTLIHHHTLFITRLLPFSLFSRLLASARFFSWRTWSYNDRLLESYRILEEENLVKIVIGCQTFKYLPKIWFFDYSRKFRSFWKFDFDYSKINQNSDHFWLRFNPILSLNIEKFSEDFHENFLAC